MNDSSPENIGDLIALLFDHHSEAKENNRPSRVRDSLKKRLSLGRLRWLSQQLTLPK